MRGGIIGLCGVMALIAGCDVIEKPLRNSQGLVSKGEFRKAVESASLIREVPMRGQALNVSRADIGESSFAVLQFVPKFTTRRDQPDMSREVLPVVARVTGCDVTVADLFGPGYFMPREQDVVIPIQCAGGLDTVSVEPVAEMVDESDIIELPEPEFDPDAPL